MLALPPPSRSKISLCSRQQSTVHSSNGFSISYPSTLEEMGPASPVPCRPITHMLLCFNPLLSNETSSLKIVAHLPGRPGYVISFIQDMRHKQDMHLTEVRDSRVKLQPPKCTQRKYDFYSQVCCLFGV